MTISEIARIKGDACEQLQHRSIAVTISEIARIKGDAGEQLGSEVQRFNRLCFSRSASGANASRAFRGMTECTSENARMSRAVGPDPRFAVGQQVCHFRNDEVSKGIPSDRVVILDIEDSDIHGVRIPTTPEMRASRADVNHMNVARAKCLGESVGLFLQCGSRLRKGWRVVIDTFMSGSLSVNQVELDEPPTEKGGVKINEGKSQVSYGQTLTSHLWIKGESRSVKKSSCFVLHEKSGSR